jgi:hypothetical protein
MNYWGCLDANKKTQESQDKEITLLGDVPTALEKMFEFVYFHQAYQDRSSKHSTWKQRYWEFSESADNPEARIQDILDLYEAADKYVVPELLKQIPYKFFLRLQDWIDPWCKQDASSSIPVTKEGLFNIIERVYELTGAWSRSELRDMLVGTISGSEPFRTVPGTWNDEEYGYGKLVHWIGDHVEALPQFGRDLFLETIPRPYTPLQERYELEFSAGYGSGNTGGVDVSWW